METDILTTSQRLNIAVLFLEIARSAAVFAIQANVEGNIGQVQLLAYNTAKKLIDNSKEL